MLRAPALALLACLIVVPAAHAADILSLRTVHAFQRADAASIFDPVRRRLLVVGGTGPGVPNSLAVLDLAGFPTWSWPQVDGAAPPSNLPYMPAVYDPVRDRMIVLEGSTLWSLKLSEPMAWSHVSVAGEPQPLAGTGVVYDSKRDRLIGFGRTGATSATWTLSLGDSPTWAPLAFAGGVPPYHERAAVAYDADQDRMVVACGNTAAGAASDTWNLTFTGGIPTWNPVAVTGAIPSPRYEPVSAYDPVSKSLYVFSGISGTSSVTGAYRLDLDTNNWEVLASSQPPGRGGAAAAWDSIGARFIFAGGLAPEKNPSVRGDLWQWSDGWSELQNTGGSYGTANLFSFDPVGRRFAAMADDRPVFLSMTDSTWTLAGPRYHAYDRLGSFYEPSTNLLCIYSADTLSSIHPGPGAGWSRSATTGDKPLFETCGPTFVDTPRHRLLVIGGHTVSLLSGYSTLAIYALDYTTATWSTLPSSSPMGVRTTPTLLDTRRDRLLFFGGVTVHTLTKAQYNDLWSFDPATLEWRQMNPGGTIPSARYYFSAAYDSSRDRVVVLGGLKNGSAPGEMIPAGGVYHLDLSNGDGTWSRYDPAGEPVPGRMDDEGGYDGVADRLFSPLITGRFYDLSFANEPPFVTVMPPPTVWEPGAIRNVIVRLKQNHMTLRTYSWSLGSQRTWPGFPLLGSLQLSDTTAVDIPIGIPVPDSVATGIDTLTFTISDGFTNDLDSFVIGDAASPSPWALFQALVERNHVRLAWWSADRSGAVADIERRSMSGAWEPRATVAVSGDGFVRFEDEAVEPGMRYAYRAGIAGTWSEEAWVDVPAASLAFSCDGLVFRGALAVGFTLPSAAPARLEAFDVAGRRVATREIGGAGDHVLELAPSGALRRGVYFLRLSQGGARVTTRAVVLGSRD